jgi:cell division protein FtsB
MYSIIIEIIIRTTTNPQANFIYFLARGSNSISTLYCTIIQRLINQYQWCSRRLHHGLSFITSMREFQEKQKIRKRIYSRTSILLLFVLCLIVGKGLVGVYEKEKASRLEVERLQKQKQEVEQKLMHVSARVDRLHTESGIEREIRSKFDIVKEGEGVIVVVDKELPQPPKEKRGVLKRFWHGVTGVFKKDKPVPQNP